MKPTRQTIVVDLDDTVCFHTNRDYPAALPNTPVILKLRELKTLGWYIIIATARGMHSCDGDLQLFEERNRHITEEWLKTYQVPFDELQFGKPLGMLYVDDKAMRPDEFAGMSVQQFKGRSGAIVQRFGKDIVKVCDSPKAQFNWLRLALSYGFNVPKVHSLNPTGFTMDFIDGTQEIPALVAAAPWELLVQFKNIEHKTPKPQNPKTPKLIDLN